MDGTRIGELLYELREACKGEAEISAGIVTDYLDEIEVEAAALVEEVFG